MIMSPDRAIRTVPLASGLRRGGWSGADSDERSGIHARGRAAARGSGGTDDPGGDAVAGRELPAGEAADGAVSRAGAPGVGARQHRATIESGPAPRAAGAGGRAGAGALWRQRGAGPGPALRPDAGRRAAVDRPWGPGRGVDPGAV